VPKFAVPKFAVPKFAVPKFALFLCRRQEQKVAAKDLKAISGFAGIRVTRIVFWGKVENVQKQ
jgi:hypothetical protein